MKNLIFYLLVLLTFNLYAQGAFYIHGVNVPPEHAEHFENMEINYLSKLAQDAVDEGEMRGWALLKRTPMIGNAADYKFNYFWVHSFKDIDQMTTRKGFWENFKKKFGFERSALKSTEIDAHGFYYFKTHTEFATENIGKYIIFNHGRALDLDKQRRWSDEVSKVFKENADESGMAGWGAAIQIAPQDRFSDRNNIFYWDVYETLTDVMKHMAGEAAISNISPELNNKFSENMPDGFSYRNILELVVATTNSKNK